MGKILIVGGVAGGATAAARLRRLDEKAQIVIVEKGAYVSFANCGLPYYIGGVIRDKEKLTLQTPESFKKRFNIDVRVGSEALRIDREKKTLEIRETDTGRVYTEHYDKLILSPGAAAIRPDLPGVDSGRIFHLRNIPDTFAIREFALKEGVKSAAVIGGGYIGLEAAENLRHLGLRVTVIEALGQVMPNMDFDMAQHVHGELTRNGVSLMLNDKAAGFEDTGEALRIRLASGKQIETDFAILAIGVRPEARLAKEAGLALGDTGGIRTDAYLRTSDPDIYAVGDAIEVTCIMGGRPAHIALASPANRQGRTAADNIAGREEPYDGALGVSILKLFDMNFVVAGLNEKALQRMGMEYEKVFTVSESHASYYPGSQSMVVKTLFDKETGRLYGAQIAGQEGVDKRIDVIASALRQGLTVRDLARLELAYAPPFSSAKDPVNMAGYVASNVLDGLTRIFHWHDVEKLLDGGSVLLDVRTKPEYDKGTIGEPLLIPVDELRERFSELPRGKRILIFCRIGLRGYIAERILKAEGFDCMNLSGGYTVYRAATRETGAPSRQEENRRELAGTTGAR